MIEARTQDNKHFRIFFMKEPDYLMNMMAIWTALDDLEETNIRMDFTDNSGTNKKNIFTYQHPCGLNHQYKQQVDYNNNRGRAPTF